MRFLFRNRCVPLALPVPVLLERTGKASGTHSSDFKYRFSQEASSAPPPIDDEAGCVPVPEEPATTVVIPGLPLPPGDRRSSAAGPQWRGVDSGSA